jgi:hypothetical protein
MAKRKPTKKRNRLLFASVFCPKNKQGLDKRTVKAVDNRIIKQGR